jgi:hypothetical protein
MCFMGTLLIFKLTFGISWVLVALLRGVIALGPVYQAWLEHLVIELRGNLVIPLLDAFVLGVTTIAVTVILPLEVGNTVLIRPLVVTTVTFVTLFHHMADCLIVPLTKPVMHLTSYALLDLAFALLCQGSICNL